MNSTDKLKQLNDSYAAFKIQFMEQGQRVVKEIFKDLFENEWINGAKWTQYTPYFNDGEPCIFGVNDISIGFVKDWSDVSPWGEFQNDCTEDEWLYNYGVYAGDGSEYTKLSEDQLKVIKDFQKLFAQIPEDIFENVFGDHCSVLATKDGFEVEEYEHD